MSEVLIVVFAVFLTVVTQVQSNANSITIYEFINDRTENGGYKFRYVQSDGTEREESGKYEGEGNYVVRGYYSYKDPTGNTQFVEYTADAAGYHPKVVVGPQPILPPTVGFGLPIEVVGTFLG